MTAESGFDDHLGQLSIPVLGGLNIGHNGIASDGGPDQTCVAIGAPATLDTSTGTLRSGRGLDS